MIAGLDLEAIRSAVSEFARVEADRDALARTTTVCVNCAACGASVSDLPITDQWIEDSGLAHRPGMVAYLISKAIVGSFRCLRCADA